MIVQLPPIVEPLPRLQRFPRVQLGLVDPQIAVRVAGAGFSVGNGKIRISDLARWGDSFMNAPSQTIPARF